MRFRILNGANARNYTFRLSNGATFTQIAYDGGLLHEPVDMDEITLSPSERAEIIIDFSAMECDETIAITDEEGNDLLLFDLDIDSRKEEMEYISSTDDTNFIKEEKSLAVSKDIILIEM